MRSSRSVHHQQSPREDQYIKFQQQQIQYLRQHAQKQARLSILLDDESFQQINHQLDSIGNCSPLSTPHTHTHLPQPPAFSPRFSQAHSLHNKQLKDSVSTTHSNFKELSERAAKSCREPATDPRGHRKEEFIIGALLGKGKFGSVHVARHKKTGFVCALKIINKAKIIQENLMTQLIREIKIQSYCDHPGLTKLYGYFSSLDQIFLITELSSEGQLYQLIQKSKLNHKPLSENMIAQILKQICEGVRYMHTLKIIHRDLKPQNILMERGVVKICDFGWAVSHNVNLRSTFCGTPLYVSPQILRGECYDQKVDLWAIGILAWELMYGEIPFQINCQQQLSKIVIKLT